MRALSSHEVVMVAGADMAADISVLSSTLYAGNFIGENVGNLIAGILTTGLAMAGKDINAAKMGITMVATACRIGVPIGIGYKVFGNNPELKDAVISKFQHYLG